jgi:hypothetical protein
MDKFVTRSSSDTNLSRATNKRSGEDITQWRVPKRFATPKPQLKTAATSTNRFSNLPVDKDGDSVDSQAYKTATRKKSNSRIPPILIEIMKDWTHQKIKDTIDQYHTHYHLEYKGNNRVKIQCYSAEGHEAVKSGLLQDNVIFHTFTRKDEKLPKVVIKGLPDSLIDSLTTELESIGFPGATATKIQLSKQVQCSPVIVQLPPGTDVAKFKKIKYLLNCVITIERFKTRVNNCTQCYRCQSFGHAARNCNRPPRCVKCSLDHPTSECPKKGFTEEVRCCNCNEDHPASYHNCMARINYLERIKIKRDPSRIDAVRSIRPNSRSIQKVTKNLSFAQAVAHHQQSEASTVKVPVTQASNFGNDGHLDSLRDSSTHEMLEILTTIKYLKQDFMQCETFMDKVILILSKLDNYV